MLDVGTIIYKLDLAFIKIIVEKIEKRQTISQTIVRISSSWMLGVSRQGFLREEV